MRMAYRWLVLATLAAVVAGGVLAADKPAATDGKAAPADGKAAPADGKTAPADAKKAAPAESKPAAPALPPLKGSQIPPDKNNCIQCHGETDLWDAQHRNLYINRDEVATDVHWQKGVNCQDCHGGDSNTLEKNEAHASEAGFLAKPDDKAEQIQRLVLPRCLHCHKNESVELFKGVHEKAGPKNEKGEATLLECAACHGKVSHHTFAVHDSRSNVFLDNQVKTCGACHKEKLESYASSVHGFGLYKAGLLSTASCADCHGAHGIYRAVDKRSTLHIAKAAQTCGKCHRFVSEWLAKSVHGPGPGGNYEAERAAPGGKNRQKPTCTSCHEAHEGAMPTSSAFRVRLPNLCGNCHANLSNRFAMSVHGELSRLGYGPAAKCSDCHGSHEILAVANPASMLAPHNRMDTCAKCHTHAVQNFLAFDPHADHTDAQRNASLHYIYSTLMTLLLTVFGVFGLHSALWFGRGLWDVMANGRPRGMRPGETAYLRFTPFHRHAHAFLLVSFLGLAITGLPLKYSQAAWAQQLAQAMGGFAFTSVWHRLFALLQFVCFFLFIGGLFRGLWRRRRQGFLRAVFGPDSPVPNLRDLKDVGAMLRWFVGLGPKPSFERWTYWEKFDLWGAVGDVLIIGMTGFILWLPNLFASFLPGSVLNIAKVIHSTQALLATGFVFAVHFFNTHLRPEKFPADMSILTGLVSADEMEHERPDYFRRLGREGRLEELRTQVPSRWILHAVRWAGFLALLLGVALLAGMIWAAMGG